MEAPFFLFGYPNFCGDDQARGLDKKQGYGKSR